MNTKDLEKVLGREIYLPFFGLEQDYRSFYNGKRVLVTGSLGSIGQQILPDLEYLGATVIETDIHDMNVLNYPSVYRYLYTYRPDIVIHLAAAKHAPAGEENPSDTYRVNAIGTENIVNAIASTGSVAHLILASTCKACNPETAYGASKLIAERMVLNSGGSVARFYNVVETSGNVFEIWNAVDEKDPICYTPCMRYFISLQEAGDYILRVPMLESGRYTICPGLPRSMEDIAHDLYPKRERKRIDARRGDRTNEPRIAAQEVIRDAGFPIERIISQHD